MSGRFTLYILVGMILGILVGYVCNENVDPAKAKQIAGYFSILTDIFLRLIKMIIGPLVFSTLVVGIVHVGDTASLSRIGFLTVGWFLCASIVSLFLGLVMVQWLEPGVGLGLPLPDVGSEVSIKAGALTLKEFITHVFPKSFFEAMSNNEILQIVVFSLFTGVVHRRSWEEANRNSRSGRDGDAADHGLRHEICADCCFCRDCSNCHDTGRGYPCRLSEVRRWGLPLAGDFMDSAPRRGLGGHRSASHCADEGDSRTFVVGVLDGKF